VTSILIVKTAALGDVLRTTAILPGLRLRYPGARIAWVTSPGAVDLVATHPDVDRVETLDPSAEHAVDRLADALFRTRWTRVISLDDEEGPCRLASRLPHEHLSGAYLSADGRRLYTPDVGPWFDMGLLSIHGKAHADALKARNTKSHPQIFAEMLGIPMGKPRLLPGPLARASAAEFAARHHLRDGRPIIGLNTGAGGRWLSKQLSVDRTVELARLIAESSGREAAFLVFGGPAETDRNRKILHGLRADHLRAVDTGCDNALLDFAALIELCDVLVTSDSLALHVAVSLDVQVVCFFAPTSAAEIELFGLGEKVVSTSPDYCSYRPDADTSSITPERLLVPVLRQLSSASRKPL
jgi:heptosyltransferase-2